MQKRNEILKILIPAVGGQGGGVLTEWLITAFIGAGYEVQSISLPGLAQRGGSTAYYIEAYKPEIGNDSVPLIFSQYPIPGDVDIILCQEFLELGRVLQQGFGSKNTSIISSTHRIYSTPEKLPVSSGIFSDEKLHSIANEFSSKFIGVDAQKLARDNNMDDLAINAILFGALGASKSIPLRPDHLRDSIQKTGIAVKNNIRAFEVGYDFVTKNSIITDQQVIELPKFVDKKILSTTKKYRKDFIKLNDYIINFFPDSLRIYLLEAVHRLIDYQDPNHARMFLETVNEVIKADSSSGLQMSVNFTKNLALLMSYEDGIRVAELKVKSLRFSKIQEEMQIAEDQIFSVTDYLKPDAYEIYGLLPNFIISPLIKIINNTPIKKLKRSHKDIAFAQKPKTTSFLGFLRLYLLSKMKFLRPYSHRFKNEYKVINKYIESTLDYASKNTELGILVTRSGSLVKGYGDVRRKTVDVFLRFIDNIIWPISMNLKDDREQNEYLLQFATKCLDSVSLDSEKIGVFEKELREKILFDGASNHGQ